MSEILELRLSLEFQLTEGAVLRLTVEFSETSQISQEYTG